MDYLQSQNDSIFLSRNQVILPPQNYFETVETRNIFQIDNYRDIIVYITLIKIVYVSKKIL